MYILMRKTYEVPRNARKIIQEYNKWLWIETNWEMYIDANIWIWYKYTHQEKVYQTYKIIYNIWISLSWKYVHTVCIYAYTYVCIFWYMFIDTNTHPALLSNIYVYIYVQNYFSLSDSLSLFLFIHTLSLYI